MSSHNLLKKLDLSFVKPGSFIVEIGSVRDAHHFDSGKNSTVFFSQIAEQLGCEFYSVDFSEKSIAYARKIVGDKAIHSDGKKFIDGLNGSISILYLDNFDIVYSDKHKASLEERVGDAYLVNNESITNERSAEVHLEQMKAAISKMAAESLVCVDDTMIKEGKWWGKGATVVPFLEDNGFEIVETGDVGLVLKKTS